MKITNIIFNTDEFNKEDILKEFKEFCYEEHNKRLTKNGKLFSVIIGELSLDFGNTSIVYSDNYDLEKDSYFRVPRRTPILPIIMETVEESKKILENVCKEYNTILEVTKTGGSAMYYTVSRK